MMFSKLKDSVRTLEKKEEFKEYIKNNSDAFLADAFIILKEQEDWQIDFYSEKKDKITSFILKENNLQMKQSDVFKKEDTKITELNLENVKIMLEHSLKLIETQTKEKTSKIIIALQVLNDKETWNITYLTKSFKTVNFKIDAATGAILSKDESSVVSNLKLGDFIKK